MATLRQLATQAAEMLQPASVTVEDLLKAADALGVALPGRDGNDPGDAIEQIVLEAVQVAQVKNCSFGEAIVSLKDSAPKAPPTKKRSSRGSKAPKFKGDSSAESEAAAPSGQPNTALNQMSRQEAVMAGVMEGLQLIQDMEYGKRLAFDLASGARQPQSPAEEAIRVKAQSLISVHLSKPFLSLEGGEVTFNCRADEITVDDAIEGISNHVFRLSDLETAAPALPSAD